MVLKLTNTGVAYLCTTLTYGTSIYLLLRGEISIGDFAATLGAVAALKMNFSRFLGLLLLSVDCGMIGKYYYTVMDYKERKGTMQKVEGDKDIELRDVSFEYVEGKRAIDKVTVSIEPNTNIAIVGRNGMGKSTFAKLLMNMYIPCEGDVIYSGMKLSDIDEFCVYNRLSAVMQNHARFYLPIIDNVDIANIRYPEQDELIQSILKKLGFTYEQVSDQPIDLQQQLGTEFGGIELSGGNWQKLAIARALFKKHEILVFDEATAAIDPLTEEVIYRSVLDWEKDKTKIFITHRLSVTKMVDRILVIDQGKIVEDGTHRELLQRNGIYAEMWRSQAKWFGNIEGRG